MDFHLGHSQLLNSRLLAGRLGSFELSLIRSLADAAHGTVGGGAHANPIGLKILEVGKELRRFGQFRKKIEADPIGYTTQSILWTPQVAKGLPMAMATLSSN
jgi:hypothetical protein